MRATGRFIAASVRAVTLTLLLLAGTWTACAHRSNPLRGLRLVDLEGASKPLALVPDDRAVVFVFLGVDCPIANRALPELAALERSLEPRGVRFAHVYAQPDEGLTEIRQHRSQFQLGPQAYRDPGLRVARRLGASRTPEAVALARDGRLIYRGRINDQYTALGVGRLQPARHDLAEALEAYLAGGTPTGRTTPAVGCSFRETPHPNP